MLVIISSSGNVIGKEIYAGDDVQNAAIVDKKQVSNPSLTYEIVDQKTFDQTVMQDSTAKDMTDWQTAKAQGTTNALSFMAKKLGLE